MTLYVNGIIMIIIAHCNQPLIRNAARECRYENYCLTCIVIPLLQYDYIQVIR